MVLFDVPALQKTRNVHLPASRQDTFSLLAKQVPFISNHFVDEKETNFVDIQRILWKLLVSTFRIDKFVMPDRVVSKQLLNFYLSTKSKKTHLKTVITCVARRLSLGRPAGLTIICSFERATPNHLARNFCFCLKKFHVPLAIMHPFHF